jgi:hypothetical protein
MRPPLPTEPATPEKVCPWFGSKCKFGTKCRHKGKPKPAAGAGSSGPPTPKPEKVKVKVKKCKKTPPAVPAAASGCSSGTPKSKSGPKPWGPCRNGADCTRPGCSFTHPSKPAAAAAGAGSSGPAPCRNGKGCWHLENGSCVYYHPRSHIEHANRIRADLEFARKLDAQE